MLGMLGNKLDNEYNRSKMRPYTGTPSNLCVYVCVGVCVKTERPMINSMCVSLRARVCVSVCVLSARVPACVCVSVCVWYLGAH